ncbi:MAG: uracil-DNA glycosylase [bacterium]
MADISYPHRELMAVADNLKRYLEQEREDGVTEVEADRAEMKKLSDVPVRPAVAATRPAGVEPEKPAKSRPTEADGRVALGRLAEEAAACKKCVLHKTRTNVVPGQGACRPEIMFVGEAPGADEDEQGLAFVGRAGQLLTKMIEAMGLTREEVFIANILKCRPPENRQPMPDEMAACLPYLRAQIGILKPDVIVTLGATAARGLLGVETGITKLRGTWMEFAGIPTMPTLHPAYLLRNPPAKKDAWADLKEVLRRIGRQAPPQAASK